MSTSTTTDDAAVDTETKVEAFLVAASATGPVQRRRQRQSEGGEGGDVGEKGGKDLGWDLKQGRP